MKGCRKPLSVCVAFGSAEVDDGCVECDRFIGPVSSLSHPGRDDSNNPPAGCVPAKAAQPTGSYAPHGMTQTSGAPATRQAPVPDMPATLIDQVADELFALGFDYRKPPDFTNPTTGLPDWAARFGWLQGRCIILSRRLDHARTQAGATVEVTTACELEAAELADHCVPGATKLPAEVTP